MLTLTNNEIGGLIRGEELTRFPPVRRPTSELESFYASLLKEITHLAGCAEKTEWHHYGSGYASFVDAWFYFPDGRARAALISGLGNPNGIAISHNELYVANWRTGTLAREEHHGIYVLLSRLSCFYVIGQGGKTWSRNGGSSYMPELKSVDSVKHAALLPLEHQIDASLSASGLKRLHRAELAPTIDAEHKVPTIFSDAPFTQFDALFFWED